MTLKRLWVHEHSEPIGAIKSTAAKAVLSRLRQGRQCDRSQVCLIHAALQPGGWQSILEMKDRFDGFPLVCRERR